MNIHSFYAIWQQNAISIKIQMNKIYPCQSFSIACHMSFAGTSHGPLVHLSFGLYFQGTKAFAQAASARPY
jgi:hypothetical protein